ncbi:hypothetical protein B0T13DRAFT_470625 [Neurospora crassa]|nr:hypothetical protein B0T13DRAFT_470625 [Neurospora crassa]
MILSLPHSDRNQPIELLSLSLILFALSWVVKCIGNERHQALSANQPCQPSCSQPTDNSCHSVGTGILFKPTTRRNL